MRELTLIDYMIEYITECTLFKYFDYVKKDINHFINIMESLTNLEYMCFDEVLDIYNQFITADI